MTTRPSRQRERFWKIASRARCLRYRVRYDDVPLGAVWDRSGGICGICGARITGRWHVEHIIPLSLGGPHALYNLVIAHARCNLIKGAKLMQLPEGPESHAIAATALISMRLRQLPGSRRIVCMPGPFSVGPLTVIARLRPPTGSVKAMLLEAHEIRTAIEDDTARVFAEGAYVAIETANPYPLRLSEHDLRPRGLVLPFGFGVDKTVAEIDFGVCPTVAVIGQTGAGKSVTMQTLAWCAARAGHRLILADPTLNTWRNLEDLDALVWSVPRSRAEVTAVLEAAVAMMFARDPADYADPNNGRPRTFVIIDEVGREGDQVMTGLDARGMAALITLMTNCRKYGMVVIWGDQRPVDKRVPKTVLEMSVAKIGHRVGSSTTSHHALGVTGAEALQGRGDALFVRPSSDGAAGVRRIQVVMVRDRWSELVRGTPPPLLPGQAAPGQPREDDTLILEAARAEGATTANAVHKLGKRLGLGRDGKGIGMGRARRIREQLTGLPSESAKAVPG